MRNRMTSGLYGWIGTALLVVSVFFMVFGTDYLFTLGGTAPDTSLSYYVVELLITAGKWVTLGVGSSFIGACLVLRALSSNKAETTTP